MSDRVIDLSDRPAFLSVKNSLLVIRFGSVAAGLSRQPDNSAGNEDENGGAPIEWGRVPPRPADVPMGARPSHSENAVVEPAFRSARREKTETADLKVGATNREEHTMPLAELAVVIASHPQISYTHAVFLGLAEAGAVFVACTTTIAMTPSAWPTT
ncbi:MAG TPA: hypothetical protein VG028_22200 [Terriglobia bacterium]|nr:hypothetical protein [Terriglobia bacterium]